MGLCLECLGPGSSSAPFALTIHDKPTREAVAPFKRRNPRACYGDGTFASSFEHQTEGIWMAASEASSAASGVAWPQLAGYQP